MPDYRRILAIEDFADKTHATARRALSLARQTGAELGLLHLIEPDTALDGGYPQPSREEARRSYEFAALRRLQHLAVCLDADDARLFAHYGVPRHEFADCIAHWQPDLVVASHDTGYLDGRHDLLTLGSPAHGGGRPGLFHWLSRWMGNRVSPSRHRPLPAVRA